MAVVGRTRRQLEIAVGYNLGAIISSSTTSAGGDATSVIDTTLKGGADDYNGYWVVSAEGTNDGEVRRVNDTVISGVGVDLTVDAFGANVPDSMSYYLWKEQYPPLAIREFIDQAIIDTTGHVYNDEESLSLHTDTRTARHDIPSQFAMLQRVEMRTRVTSLDVHECDLLFDETTDSDFTQALDTEDKRHGSSSLKLTIGSSVSAGDFVTDSIASTDISKYTHLEGWVKATTTLAANDFVIRLDSGVVQGNSTDLEILNVPATTAADRWTFFRVALDNPESDTAIISVGLEYNANQAANTVWFDHLKVVNNESAIWDVLNPALWKIDGSSRDLVLVNGGLGVASYRLLKLIGGDLPARLTADTTVNEIDDTYVIARATELALTSRSGGPATDPKAHMAQADRWHRRAQEAMRSFPYLIDVREVG